MRVKRRLEWKAWWKLLRSSIVDSTVCYTEVCRGRVQWCKAGIAGRSNALRDLGGGGSHLKYSTMRGYGKVN